MIILFNREPTPQDYNGIESKNAIWYSTKDKTLWLGHNKTEESMTWDKIYFNTYGLKTEQEIVEKIKERFSEYL